MSQTSDNLTQGSLLARNTLYSLIGYLIPVIVAIFSIPILISALGTDGFGVLTIAWMVTGYFSLLDLGVGRALTKMLSEKLGRDDIEDIPSLIWTALMLTLLMGLLGSLIITLSSSTLVTSVFKIPLALHSEVEKSFYILAASVPIVICNAALRGTLESYQRFDLINILRVPIGSLTFIAPILVLPFSVQLSHIVISLVLVRFIELFINLFFCKTVVPEILKNFRINNRYIYKFLSFGGWMTISNIIGPLMLYLDRFLIGSIISISAVSYYATSYEIIHRLMVIPGAIVGVLFPAFGALIGSNPRKAAKMLFSGVKYTFISVFPIIIIIFIFANEGLNIWLGDEFSDRGTTVLKLLVVGALINSLAYFPFAMLHASGRPDLTAKLHLAEAPIYMLIAWILITKYGIEGAAITWVLRAIIDTIILFIMAGRGLNITYPKIQISLIALAVCSLLFISIFLPENLYFKLCFTATSLLVFAVLSWKILLNQDEKSFIFSYSKKSKSSILNKDLRN